MLGDEVSFSLLPDDGFYAIGIIEEVDLQLQKTVSDLTPSRGDTVTFTLSVTNAGPNAAVNASVVDNLPAGFGNLTMGTAPAPSSITISGNTLNWTNISVPAGGVVSATFTADVL